MKSPFTTSSPISLPGRSRAKYHDRAACDAHAFEMAEGLDGDAFRDADAGPEHDILLTDVPAPIAVSAAKYTVSGSARVTPAAMCAARARRWKAASATLSSAWLLTPSTAAGASTAAQRCFCWPAIWTTSVR